MTADRALYDEALRPARTAAYDAGEFVGQESFMSAAEIRTLAVRAGVGAGTRVLDLCCGVAGPGRLLAAETACDYLGVDADAGAVALARRRAVGLTCCFAVARVPPVPAGPFDVVLLLETLLAFPVKAPLLETVAACLAPGGRFVLTVEEGAPLTDEERVAMPASDTVWPAPLPVLVDGLGAAGLELGWTADWSHAHRARAEALADAFLADRRAIARRIGAAALEDLVTSHRLWGEWLRTGRVRKLAVVAVRAPRGGERHGPPARSPG